ncbi:hypothetical protein WS90_13900 [Burkholderia cepacia]|uniref:Uncharacterized protein n=1 Tax=Burkholderia cepacia TaxID=292 RepID=A0A103ZNE5_BURCE|nr:hypothetical protein WS90_13900 [Burkholderia cepacia]
MSMKVWSARTCAATAAATSASDDAVTADTIAGWPVSRRVAAASRFGLQPRGISTGLCGNARDGRDANPARQPCAFVIVQRL